MTHEQFCRSLVLLNSVPQSLCTLGFRLSLQSSPEDRAALYSSLDQMHTAWSQKKATCKAQLEQGITLAKQVDIDVLTTKRNGN